MSFAAWTGFPAWSGPGPINWPKPRTRSRCTWAASPTNSELAGELNMDMDEFTRLQRDANAASLVSLNTKCGDAEGEKDVYEIDVIKDHRSEDPLLEAQKRDLKNLLTKGLTRAERLIIVLYYYEEMTMKEIGATLDLSESRVSQMHSSIVARLKAQMNTRKKEFAVE